MLTGLALTVTQAPLDVPIVLGREEAQRLARLELAKPIYASEQEPLVSRILRWVLDHVAALLDNVGSRSPLGWYGLLGIALVIAIIVIVVRRRIGGLRRESIGSPLFDGTERSADDFRAEAERYARSGAWAEAVRARLRAIVRDLEERGLIDIRPGRTADEIARDAGRALPGAAADLRSGARLFDDVWYGERAADATTYARLVAVDDAVTSARPGPVSSSQDSIPAVPR